MKHLYVHTFFIFSMGLAWAGPNQSSAIPAEVQKNFFDLGGSQKALKHLDCILTNQTKKSFALKVLDPKEFKPEDVLTLRCNQVENNEPKISVHNMKYAVIVDFTKKSSQRRLYLLPLNSWPSTDGRPGGATEKIKPYYTSHGRNGETNRHSTTDTPKLNSILNARFFGNSVDGNASPTGFFITGAPFVGHYSGHDRKHAQYSLTLHGVEAGVNENTCRRAVIVHGSGYMKESGPKEGTGLMSSGCFMLDYEKINAFIEKVKGEAHSGGAVFFAYGPREAQLSDDFYCKPLSQKAE